MILDIEFAPQLEAQIAVEAQQRGLRPVDLVKRVVEERFSVAFGQMNGKSPAERIADMDALATKYADLPILPNSAFDRANIYEDEL
jgi:hypothetical protein